MKRKFLNLIAVSSFLLNLVSYPISSYAAGSTGIITNEEQTNSETISDLQQAAVEESALEEDATATQSSSSEIDTENVAEEETQQEVSEDVEKRAVVAYQTHVNTLGWQDAVGDGEVSGVTEKDLWIDGLKLNIENSDIKGSIKYKAQIKNKGWQDWVEDGAISGSVDQALPTEAYQIQLTGELAEKYDIYYRVCSSKLGWLDWAKNGQSAGTEGFSYQVEALQVQLVEKNGDAPGSTKQAYVTKTTLNYQSHVQNIGWQSVVGSGEVAGTTGKSLWLEGLKIKVENSSVTGTVQYKSHVKNIGWQNWVENGALSGTVGRSLPTEAFQIQLTGELAEKYDVYYRVHSKNFGWLDWARNGESAGTEGFAYYAEAVQVELVNKGDEAPGKTNRPFIKKGTIFYQAHVQNVGWQSLVGNGKVSGTTGRGLWLEGLKLDLENGTIPGNVEYKAHVKNIGWQNWISNGNLSGTVGRSLPTEAYQMRLTGELANVYDIYYRVHSKNFGWLGWAKNGQSAGSQGYSYHMEAIQVEMRPKGWNPPGTVGNAFKDYAKPDERIITSVPFVSQYTPVFAPWGCAAAAMTMLLRSKGATVDLKYAQDHLPMFPQNVEGQKGNVYTGNGFGWVIKPRALTNYMKKWYPKVTDISGTNVNNIISQVLSGKPVLYYGFSSYQKVGDLNRNHCKVIAGYKNNQFLVYDPLYYRATDGPGTGGRNMLYDKGAKHWLPIKNFQNEYNGQAIVIN